MRFYICRNCGNFVEVIEESNRPMSCCGRYMEEVIPGRTDASKEKHVPVIQIDGNKVTVEVGSKLHPMEKNHYIEWICIETTKGTARKNLAPEEEPKAEFILDKDEKLVAAYAYCNLHSLWMATP